MQTLARLKNGELKGVSELTLSEGLIDFPVEIFELADTLVRLDLSNNKLSALPADFGRLQKLEIFFCSGNQFTVLPEVLGDCPLLDIVGFKFNKITIVPAKALNPNLRWLILTDNKIKELPPQIGNCARLQKLMLSGNKLEALPIELARCCNLGLLRISANKLTALPAWLLQMPKLSWLAFSGNVFSKKPVIKELPTIPWHHLTVGEVLGEGASGIIVKVNRQFNGEAQDAAVKIFKGAVTSDGNPEDEMMIHIAAGDHLGLVQVIGEITMHPQDKKGVMMGLIPQYFYNLGKPPSMASCTRDVFDGSMQLTALHVLKIATTIASVAAQLHSRGIMHGDLYAHNILIDNEGNTLFGDFGAASFYDINDTDTAYALQRLEVSAFGNLLDDLLYLSRMNKTEALSQLRQLCNMCTNEDVSARPDFVYLNLELEKVAKA